MAQSSVVLGVWDSSRYQSFKIENLDLDGKVEVLKDEACKKLNSNKITLDLVYCGLILEDDHSLSSYGVRSGVTIFVVKKPSPHVVPQSRTLSEMEVQQLVVTFRAFTASSGYRTALQRLARPEVLETIIAATPGLAEDPAAVAIIQDPELIVHMADPETVRKVAESHPSLIEAASYIAAHVHEEQANVIANQATTSTGYSYSLEALSDDEDMEMPSSSSSSNNNRDRNPQQQHQQQQQQQSSVYNNNIGQPLARNASYNAITAAQLAAAIANATNTAFNTNSAGMPRTNATAMTSSSSVSNSPSPTTMSSSANLNLIGGNSNGSNNGGQLQQQGQSSGQANNLITSEMFSNAIQQAFAFGGNTTSGGASTLPAAANNTSSSNAPPSAQQNIFGGFATSGGGAVNQVPPEETLEGVVRRLQPQLSQMHEMGLNNDVLNVRALQATGGNVEAAIELVFSGLVD